MNRALLQEMLKEVPSGKRKMTLIRNTDIPKRI